MEKQQISGLYTSDDILKAEDLYNLQDTFSSSAIPFKYRLTDGEIEWYNTMKEKYSIADYIKGRLSGPVLTFSDPDCLTEALEADGTHPKAPMLSDDSALQKLFFWLA